MVSGSARKVLETKPPSVTAAHTAKNTTKKAHAQRDARAGRYGLQGRMRLRAYFMKRVSASFAMSGSA
jgi:hypothetical protein